MLVERAPVIILKSCVVNVSNKFVTMDVIFTYFSTAKNISIPVLCIVRYNIDNCVAYFSNILIITSQGLRLFHGTNFRNLHTILFALLCCGHNMIFYNIPIYPHSSWIHIWRRGNHNPGYLRVFFHIPEIDQGWGLLSKIHVKCHVS